MRRFARLARLKMMTPTSLCRTTLFLLGLAAVVMVTGCRKQTTSFHQTPNQSTPAATQTSQRPDSSTRNESAEATKTVERYLVALQSKEFSTAYELLSRDSKQTHTISDFEQQGKQGMPSFDLKSAEATIGGKTAVVSLQQLDDPATHGFHLIREDGAWKIVYQGGVPGMPYAE